MPILVLGILPVQGSTSHRAEQVARSVLAAFAGCGAMDFAYGQGSVFTGFTAHSDLDDGQEALRR